MFKGTLTPYIGGSSKRVIKSAYSRIRKVAINRFMSYDGPMLIAALKRVGITEKDTVMLHVNFKPDSGFQGAPADLVDVLKRFPGKEGNLLMVSIPFRGSAYDYLVKARPFRIRKTMSLMGLVTEVFRKTEGVKRSLHPTHPVLAYGKDSAWFVQGHESCDFPCGPGTPYEKLRQAKGKILFFDVSFGAITFFHYVEDIIKDRLPFALYHGKPFQVTCYDEQDRPHEMRTYAFSKGVVRNTEKLEQEMARRHLIKKGKVGNSEFLVVNAEDVVACFASLMDAEMPPYDDWPKPLQ